MMTDNAGRFTATQKFRNKVKVIVKFKNNDSIIRSIRGVRIWSILLPLEFNFGPISGSQINTFQHQFNYNSDVSSVANLVWNAATVNNAVQEHKVYATQLGIGLPPSKLKIFLTRNKKNGLAASTPLFAKRAVYDINVLFDNTYGINYSAGAGVDLIISQYIAGELDIILGYYTPGQNSITSDEVMTTMYHELSHAIHYNKVGNTWYTEFVNAELTEIANYYKGNTFPYGPGNNSVSAIIALGEGWAYHMGHFMANLKYGTLAPCQSEEQIARCPGGGAHPHVDVIELYNPTSNYVFHWIPKGLMLDLMDNTTAEQIGPVPLADQVTGYTNQQFYNALQSDVNSIGAFRDRLLQQNNNNQQQQVINLVHTYGY